MEDLGRYALAAGWEPEDRWEKAREKARKEYAEQQSYGETMLEVRPASRWITPPSQQKPRRQLFGPLWRMGEVAILFGPKASGKSLFSVQLAQDLAIGKATLLSVPGEVAIGSHKARRLKTHDPGLKTLLIDFELSTAQFTERYTLPPALAGKLPRRPRFNFQRAALNWDGSVPEAFRGNVNKFLLHSIEDAIERSEAKVIIIDSLNHLPRNMANATGAVSMMKNLKHLAARENLSILVLANSVDRVQRRPETRDERQQHELSRSPVSRLQSLGSRPLSLRDISAHRSVTEIADTVFALSTSTYGAEYRYIKHLASRSTPIAPEAEVLTYQLPENADQLAGNAGPLACSSPQSLSRVSSLPSPVFFTYLGPSTESDHLRDYQAEALAANRAQERQLKQLARRSSKDILVDGMLDGSYMRYLRP